MARKFKKSGSVDKKARLEKIRRDAEAKASGNSTGYSFREHNVFKVLSVPDLNPADGSGTELPYRTIKFHYNPFHVCSAPPHVFDPDDPSKLKFVSLFGCPVCERAHKEFGRRDGEDRNEWYKSKRYQKYSAHTGKTKVIFYALDLSDFYEPVKSRKNWKLNLIENGEKLWGLVSKKLIQHLTSDEVKKAAKEGGDIPPLVITPKSGRSISVGVRQIVMPGPTFADKIHPLVLDLLDDGEEIDTFNDDGGVGILTYVNRTGKGQFNVQYDAELVEPDTELIVSDDLWDAIEGVIPENLYEIYKPLSDEEYEKIIKERFEEADEDDFEDDFDDLDDLEEEYEKSKKKDKKSKKNKKSKKEKKEVDELDDDFNDVDGMESVDDDDIPF